MKEVAAATKELEAQMWCWQCNNVEYNAWMHSELQKHCSLCKRQRPKVKREVVEKDLLNVQGKHAGETIERLNAGASEEDELAQ